jgi:hypothetical protein
MCPLTFSFHRGQESSGEVVGGVSSLGKVIRDESGPGRLGVEGADPIPEAMLLPVSCKNKDQSKLKQVIS